MKTFLPAITSLLAFLITPFASAQQINWGSPVLSTIVDSKGSVIDNSFVFELGAFKDGFVPNAGNLSDWYDNWRIFDTAGYNSDVGGFQYYTGTAAMLDSGESNSPTGAGGFSFGGLEAYVWVRNSNDAVEGVEWFLARSELWEFPNAFPGCCDNALPDDWSLSDLKNGGVTPVFGSQDGLKGAGEFTADGVFSLQTYTIIPEPSSALLAAGGLMALILRRRRNG